MPRQRSCLQQNQQMPKTELTRVYIQIQQFLLLEKQDIFERYKIFITSKQSKSQMQKTPKQHKNQSSEQQLQVTLMSPLTQLLTYDPNNFVHLTLTLLKLPLENQIKKIAQIRNLTNKQLLLVVLNNHIKAIVDLSRGSGALSIGGTSRRSFNDKITVGMYEELGNQFYENDQQLSKLIILSNDLPRAQGAIQLAIKNYTNRNYRFRNNKVIESRVKLLELILALLRVSNGQERINYEIPPLPELRTKGTSFHELEVSYVRLIVQQLDQKVYELSTISQQIPQLQTFKRTLDLTMPEHNVYLTRIVDVLIELHHKINKLLSRRPQKLLRQIEAVEQECLIIQQATAEFLQKLESNEQIKLRPIYFDQKNNKSPDYFRKIQKNVVKMSESILQWMSLQFESRQRIVHIRELIEIFWNLIEGVQQYERQWKMYKNRQKKTPDQEQIIQLLEMCLKYVNERIDKMNEQFQIERQTLIDGNSKNIQFLQEDIAKMSRENDEMRTIIQQIQKQNQQYRADLEDLQKKYKDLSKKYDYDVNDLLSKISLLQKKEKGYKDKIQSLEAENEQKKVMITNITNDLKRAIKQSQNSQKTEQSIEKLTIHVESLETEIRVVTQDYQIAIRQKQQVQRNNQLIITKLNEANRRITDLENQTVNLQHRNQRQRTQLRDQIDELERKIRRLNQQLANNAETRTKQYDRKDTQYRQAISKKDDKISQLNSKILQLNSKLNEMLDSHRNFEFQLKRKQRNLEDLQNRLRDTEGKKNIDYADMLKNYQVSQKQLSIALNEIQQCKNILVPSLEAELKKRQQLISQLQNIIHELERKHSSHISNEERNAKRQREQLEQKLRARERELINKIEQLQASIRQKDIKIRQLQFTVNINHSRITQLQSHTRLGDEDKNRLIKDLESKTHQNQNNSKKLQQLQLKLANYERDTRRLAELQARLGGADKDKFKLQQLQSKLLTSERDRLRLQELQAKLLGAERDRLRIQELQEKLRGNENDRHRLQELVSKSERDKIRLQDLQAKILATDRDKFRIQQLQAKSQKDRFRIQELENRIMLGERDKLRIQQLESKIHNIQRQRQRIQQLESKLSISDKDKHRIQQLQSRIANYQQQLRNYRNLEGQHSRIKTDNQRRIKQLDFALNDAHGKLQRAKNVETQLRHAQNRIIQFQSQVRRLKQQLARAKLNQSGKNEQANKIYSLEATINDKNRLINDLENKIRNLQYQIKQLQRQADRSTGLMEDLRARQREIAQLKLDKSALELNKGNEAKLKQTLKQVEYLKQKIRSLQDLIDIFVEQHSILEAKIKQYRLRSNLTKDASGNHQKLLQQNIKLTQQIRAKDLEIQNFKREKQQHLYYSPINNRNLFEQSASKQKLDQSVREVRQLKDKISENQSKYQRQHRAWTNRQKQYENQIRVLRSEVENQQNQNRTHKSQEQNLQNQIKILRSQVQSQQSQTKVLKSQIQNLHSKISSSGGTEGEKYFLKIEGQRLEQIVRRMQNGTYHINSKLDEILTNSRKVDESTSSQHVIDINVITEQNKILIEQIRKMMKQKEELSTIVRDYPNPDFITEYVFRIITYFSEVHPESPEGNCIWEQLLRIRKTNSGEQYFIILQEFTKYTLHESALEIYRRQLRQKAKQLQMLKQRVDTIFQNQITSEKVVYEKTALTESRIMMFRDKFMNVLNPQNNNSNNSHYGHRISVTLNSNLSSSAVTTSYNNYR